MHDDIGAPLRGWLVADPKVTPERPLDEKGITLLGVAENQSIRVRPLYTPQVAYRSAPQNKVELSVIPHSRRIAVSEMA